MTEEAWLASHPYLEPVAEFEARVDAAAAEVSIPRASIPRWDDYIGDFHDGVPLPYSSGAAVDLGPAERVIASLVEKLASRPLPGKLVEESRALDAELHGDSDSARHPVAWL